MTAFTRIGATLWDWEPWTRLEMATAQILWLALYTTSEAKRHAPGLWQGGIPMMTEASHMPSDEVVNALDRLLEREMVEYDPKFRVLRLCVLPDAGEFPSNGKVILGWWTKFKTVPQCPVRDAHVRTLEWICSEGAKQKGKDALTPHHQQAWSETFGTITPPAVRRRGIRRMGDSDTSTLVQPSLFGGSGNGIPLQGEASYPPHPHPAVDNSAALQQPNKIRAPETVSDTLSDTNRIPDPGSRIPELDLLSGSGEGGRGGGHEIGRPVLTLVPPYTAADVIRELALGNWDPVSDKTHQEALSALVPLWVAARVVMEDFAVLRQYSLISGRRMSASQIAGLDIAGLGSLISTARRTVEWRAAQTMAMAESLP